MILLDTNVLSEVLLPLPDLRVERWMDSQPDATLFIDITEAELRYGMALPPPGRRRTALAAAISRILAEDFADRILPFDSPAAAAFAEVAASRRRAGRPTSQSDAQIAAIARSRGAAVVTRNVRDFVECGIEVVNPWT